MSFLLWLSIVITSLSSEVIWQHTEIEVPLNGDFRQAMYEIEALLYIDGIKIEEPRVIYKYDGVERTFLSTINTSILRTYSHKIEAYFPDYNIRNIISLSIKVIDDIPPVIMSVPDLCMRVGDKLPNLLLGFKAQDNYDHEDVLDIKIDASQVKSNTIGSYPITYYVSDLSGNITQKSILIDVYDDVSPIITLLKPLDHNIDHPFSWQTYFSVTDNYDLFPKIFIESPIIDHLSVGIYPFRLEVIDQSGNTHTITTTINVFDKTPPTLKISDERPDIPYQIDHYEHILKGLILNVTDNVDDLSIEDVEIISSILINQIGIYKTTYQVSDQSKNITTMDIYLKVTDQEKPEIMLIKPLVFDVFDPKPILEEYVDIKDNLSLLENMKIEFIGSFHMNQIGKYLITIKATDEAKNQAILTTYLEILDYTIPEITLIQDILITQFKPINYLPYFEINDLYDDISDIELIIDDSLVNYQQVGVYPIYVMAIDPSSNTQNLIVDVIIMDIEPPTIELVTDQIIDYPYQGQSINYLSYVNHISDNHDDLDLNDITIKGSVDTNHFGLYEIYYHLEDSTGNETIKNLKFRIIDHQSPSITFSDLVINQYESIDFLEGVSLDDNTNEIEIIWFPKAVDTSAPGSIMITYVAYDERGNYIVKDRMITILPVESPIPIIRYIPFASILVIGFSLCAFIYFKDIKHMF